MSPSNSDYWQRRYPERRAVRGGVETGDRRRANGKTWLGRSLIDIVESFTDPGRMSRGRDYARDGQVVSIRVENGAVVGEVQGSQPFPFTSTFFVRELTVDQRDQLIAVVRDSPGMLADIVSGSLSTELGPLLLPRSAADMAFDCTCPDGGHPCKHVAALAYRTADRLDEHPLDILALRGIDLDTLISGIETSAADDDTDDTTDLYGDHTVLPALPSAEPRSALDDLDPAPLRTALRLITDDEHTVAAALATLKTLYTALTDHY